MLELYQKMPQQKIRVMIAHDQTVVREGLAAVLNRQKHIEVTAHAKKLSQVPDFFRKHRPNILIMDLRMDGEETFATIQMMKAEFPSAAVLIISGSEGSEIGRASC